jgi:hypothetical protein
MEVLVDLQESNGTNMGRILQTNKSCVDICDFIGSEMHSKLIKFIIDNNLKFSILVDECTTISHLSVLILCVRAAFSEKPTTIYLDLIEITSAKADNLAEVIIKCLDANFGEEFLKTNWISFTADGASSMMGRKSGVAQQLKEKYPQLIIWHCSNHRLELAVGDAIKEVTGTFNFKSLMDKIYSIYQASPKNQRELNDSAEVVAILFQAIGRVLNTRWSASSERTVQAVFNMYSALVAHFLSASQDMTRESKES